MHEVLINCLGGLSLSRKSVDRLTDRPDVTLDVYRGPGLEKSSVLLVLDRFFSLKTDFVLNRKVKKLVHKSLLFFRPITVYNSYLSRQYTVQFTPYNTLSCLIHLYTRVLHDLGVSSADHTNIGMKRVGPLYTACRVEG